MAGPELPIADPELRERLSMGDLEFGEYLARLAATLPPRPFGPGALERALAYPWKRPAGSYRLTPGGVANLAEMSPAERDETIAELSGVGERMPLLAIGSNGAPRVLERKFAALPEGRDRSVLALVGRLHGFDVGAAAQPALYGALPATLFPSPETAVAATLLWVTPAQLTQLAWSEVSYRLGSLRARFEVTEGGAAFDEVVAFVSRFGAFCIDGGPVALEAVAAERRAVPGLSQEQALDAAAALALGPRARAATLVRAMLEEYAGILPTLAHTVNRESLPFSSPLWSRFP